MMYKRAITKKGININFIPNKAMYNPVTKTSATNAPKKENINIKQAIHSIL